jgi:hypothetical protein
MNKRHGWIRTVPVWVAALLAGVAWLAFGWRESPMAVVVNLHGVGLAAACAGALLGLWGLRLLRPARPAVTRGVALVVIVAAAGALGAWTWFRSTYSARDVRFASGQVELAGTLFSPPGPGPWPAAVLVHGSGPETRREGSLLGRYLARRGIAALAYDKRGTGASGGELYASDYGDYASDASAAVRLLAGRPEIDRSAIGLVGTSEAEWVAPIAAHRSARVAFVAIVGASGLSPAEQVTEEMAMRLESRGYGEPRIARARALSRQVLQYQRTGEGGAELAAALDDVRSEAWFRDAEDLPDSVYPVSEYHWWRSVMDTDPRVLWQRVHVPVLLLKGADDDRSRPGPMASRIRAALAAGGNEDLTVHVFPDADHLLLRWPLGQRTPPPVFADGYPEILVDWIRAHVGRAPARGTTDQRESPSPVPPAARP